MDERMEQRSATTARAGLDALDGMGTPPRWRERARAAWRKPLVRALAGVVAIGLLALLYLNQVAGVAVANDRLSRLSAEQNRLQRQDSQLHAQLGGYTSPVYIDRRARQIGLAPAPFGSAVYITISHGPIPMNGQNGAGGEP